MYEESRDLMSVYWDYYGRPGRCHEEGRMDGRKEGQVEAQAELISQMAKKKFDSRTGDHLLAYLKKMADPEWVAEIGEGIIECNDDKDLLKRAKQSKWTQWWRHPSRNHSMREGWADGRAEGWVDGWAQGQADGQVSLLRWQASWKFDVETAERLTEWLVEITDLDDMHQVSEWLIKCESGEELLERVTVKFGIPVPETVEAFPGFFGVPGGLTEST